MANRYQANPGPYVSFIAIILLSPLMLLAAILIKLTAAEPSYLFKQVGLHSGNSVCIRIPDYGGGRGKRLRAVEHLNEVLRGPS